MNGQDILDALSGIDPKYIEEAADTQNNLVDITSVKRRRSIRKTLYVVLPSVAAILLIVAVALPAVLRVSKSESATMAEAPAAAAEQKLGVTLHINDQIEHLLWAVPDEHGLVD